MPFITIFNKINLFLVFLNLISLAGLFILILDPLAIYLLLLKAKESLESELRLPK
jgi:hypothetical protein